MCRRARTRPRATQVHRGASYPSPAGRPGSARTPRSHGPGQAADPSQDALPGNWSRSPRRPRGSGPAPVSRAPLRTTAPARPQPRPARQHLAVHCGRTRSPEGRGKEDAGGCRAGVSLGPGRGNRALPLSPARHRLPGFQDGRRGGAVSLQPFPLPVRAPRPLAGLSRRRKRRKRRKFAMLRKRIRVLWLRAQIVQLQNLVTPRD